MDHAKAIAENMYNPWRLTEKHLVRIKSVMVHVHTGMGKHSWGQFSFDFQENNIPQLVMQEDFLAY